MNLARRRWTHNSDIRHCATPHAPAKAGCRTLRSTKSAHEFSLGDERVTFAVEGICVYDLSCGLCKGVTRSIRSTPSHNQPAIAFAWNAISSHQAPRKSADNTVVKNRLFKPE
jgi:hypothetical protein